MCSFEERHFLTNWQFLLWHFWSSAWNLNFFVPTHFHLKCPFVFGFQICIFQIYFYNSINFLGEVTTPQIEALMFPAGAYSSTSSEANLSSPDAEVTIRADLTKVKISVSTPVNSTSATALTSSLPNYDLNKLFSGVQDSGGEGMMAFTPGKKK